VYIDIKKLAIVFIVLSMLLSSAAVLGQDHNAQSAGLDMRTIVMIMCTVITLLCAALTSVIGMYMRGIESKLDKKIDNESMKLLFDHIGKSAESFALQIADNATRSQSQGRKIHAMEMLLAQQHPTKRELREVIDNSLIPLTMRINALKEAVDAINKELG